MKRLAFIAALAVSAASLTAQAPPAFDVASVKRTTGAPGVPPIVFIQADRLRAPFSTVRELVQAAYGVEQNQVVGGPEWAGSDHFDVNATLPPNTGVADSQRMLQRLLADRFGLITRREKRQLPVYFLDATGKPGPELTAAGAECKPLKGPAGIPPPPPPPPPPPGAGPMIVLNQPAGSKCGNVVFNGFVSMRSVPLATFATLLSRQIRIPIVDRTRLAGLYDLDLSFLPDTGPMMFNGAAINADAPSLQTAVREQLGLRLQSGRAPVDVVVIDRVAPPTGN